jgi:pimeloyl-ACP methyl ester carboxylesterase
MSRHLTRTAAPPLAYAQLDGAGPTVVFCHGFMSDMTGSKALALEALCAARGQAFVRYDGRGHGGSGGSIREATISDWLADLLDVLAAVCPGEVVLVGSSMGGWLSLLAARDRPDVVRALVLIAPAPDFTRWGMWDHMDELTRRRLRRDGEILKPSAYGPEPYVITRALIEDGNTHLMLDAPIAYGGPARILHGQEDPDVPWRLSLTLAEKLSSPDVRLSLIKDGDHRLSREADIAVLCRTVDELLSDLATTPR